MKGLLRILVILTVLGITVSAALSAPKRPGDVTVLESTPNKLVLLLYLGKETANATYWEALMKKGNEYCAKFGKVNVKPQVSIKLDSPIAVATFTCK